MDQGDSIVLASCDDKDKNQWLSCLDKILYIGKKKLSPSIPPCSFLEGRGHLFPMADKFCTMTTQSMSSNPGHYKTTRSLSLERSLHGVLTVSK